MSEPRPDAVERGLFLVLTAIAVWLVFLVFRPFLAGITWAVVLTVSFHPLYRRLVGLFRGRAWIASTLLTALVAAFVVVPATVAAIKLGQGVADGYAWLQGQQAQGKDFLAEIEQLRWVADARDWIGRYVDVSQIDPQDVATSAAQAAGNAIVGRTKALLTNVLSTIVTLLVLLVTMAVLFHESSRVLVFVRRILPLSEPDKEAMLTELESVARAVFFGVLVTALVQGLLGGLGFAVLGLPAPVTFAAAMFFCALFPVGTAVVWGPAAIWLFLDGHPAKAVILLVWGAGIVSTIDNVLRPILVGRGLKLHTLVVFFGIFGGLVAFGLVGIFLGPIVIATLLFLLDVLRRDHSGEVKA